MCQRGLSRTPRSISGGAAPRHPRIRDRGAGWGGDSAPGTVRRRQSARRARGGEKRGRGRRSRTREALEADALRPGCGLQPRPGPVRSCPAASRSVPSTGSSHPPGARGALQCFQRSHGSALLPGRLRRGRLRPGPHSVSLQPARERRGEWRGLPGAHGVHLDGGRGWTRSGLRRRALPGACSRHAYAQNSASHREAGRKCAAPGPCPCAPHRLIAPSY